jgi:hypothetical protein
MLGVLSKQPLNTKLPPTAVTIGSQWCIARPALYFAQYKVVRLSRMPLEPLTATAKSSATLRKIQA